MSADLVIGQKLYWLPVSSVDEARYLTAVLNSPVVTRQVSVYQARGLHGPRDFDTYVWYLPIPVYDSDNELHQRLVDLAEGGRGGRRLRRGRTGRGLYQCPTTRPSRPGRGRYQ